MQRLPPDAVLCELAELTARERFLWLKLGPSAVLEASTKSKLVPLDLVSLARELFADNAPRQCPHAGVPIGLYLAASMIHGHMEELQGLQQDFEDLLAREGPPPDLAGRERRLQFVLDTFAARPWALGHFPQLGLPSTNYEHLPRLLEPLRHLPIECAEALLVAYLYAPDVSAGWSAGWPWAWLWALPWAWPGILLFSAPEHHGCAL